VYRRPSTNTKTAGPVTSRTPRPAPIIEAEYTATKAQVTRFEQALAAPQAEDDLTIQPAAYELERQAIATVMEELREELAKYEAEYRLNLVGAEQK